MKAHLTLLQFRDELSEGVATRWQREGRSSRDYLTSASPSSLTLARPFSQHFTSYPRSLISSALVCARRSSLSPRATPPKPASFNFVSSPSSGAGMSLPIVPEGVNPWTVYLATLSDTLYKHPSAGFRERLIVLLALNGV